MHSDNSHEHHKETHGVRNDIDENTPLDDVRAPNVFERAKEEVEALIQTIHPKKGSPPHEIRLYTRALQMIQHYNIWCYLLDAISHCFGIII